MMGINFRNIIAALILLSSPVVAFADTLEQSSKITAVTVYPGAAHITRAITLDLPAGAHTIVFDSINPPLDENTLAVS